MSSLYLKRNTSLAGDRYKIQKVIGVGGFGCVYLALGRDGKQYAIKECFDQNRVGRSGDGQTVVVHTKVSPNAKREHEHQRKRAREEAQRFGNNGLRHRNLVPIYESFDQFETTYLVMPYLDGEPLHEVATRQRDSKWVFSVLCQIGSALEFLHKNNLIHRDLKPDNVLIVGENATPVLLDTGATRDFYDSQSVHTGIQTDFGPPEIVTKVEANAYGSPGPWSDCFALAGMAYLLLAGVKPEPWTTRALELRGAQNSDPLVKPITISDAVWSVIKKSLSLRTMGRHARVSDFLNDFSSAISLTEKQEVKEENKPPERCKSEVPQPITSPSMESKIPFCAFPDIEIAVAITTNLIVHLVLFVAFWLIFDDPISAVASFFSVILASWVVAIYLIRKKIPMVWSSFPGVNIMFLFQVYKKS